MESNLPNALTVSRIVAIPVVCLLLLPDTSWGAWVALVVYTVACITDFLDGYLARTWQQQSRFGRMLDPIADKLLVASLLLMLVGIDRLSGVHILPAAVILCREITVSGLREYLAELRVGMPVTRLAKWKTGIQMGAIGFLVVGDAGPIVRTVHADPDRHLRTLGGGGSHVDHRLRLLARRSPARERRSRSRRDTKHRRIARDRWTVPIPRGTPARWCVVMAMG